MRPMKKKLVPIVPLGAKKLGRHSKRERKLSWSSGPAGWARRAAVESYMVISTKAIRG